MPVNELYYIWQVSFNNVESHQNEVGEMHEMYDKFKEGISTSDKKDSEHIIFSDWYIATAVWGDF